MFKSWAILPVLFLTAAWILLSGCGSSGDSIEEDSASGTSGDTTSTTGNSYETQSDPESPGTSSSTASSEVGGTGGPDPDSRFGDAPPLVMVLSAPVGNVSNPLGVYGPDYFGLDLPAAYLADPGAPVVFNGTTEEDSRVSPDGSLIATFTPADALRADGFDFIATTTGEQVDRVEYTKSDDRFGLQGVFWSPDSRALFFNGPTGTYFHRITGGSVTVDGNYLMSGFTSNADASDFLACRGTKSIKVSISKDGLVTGPEPLDCDAAVQTFDQDRNPVMLYEELGTIFRTVPGSDPIEILNLGDKEDTFNEVGFSYCGESVNITFSETVARPRSIYHTPSGRLTEAPNLPKSGCAVFAADAGKAAYRTDSGSVEVVDLETGEVVEVARDATPWAFNSEGDHLLVEGNGTFLVSIDGSGGREAAAQAISGGSEASFCAAGSTGLGLMLTNTGIGLYDISEDELVLTDAPTLREGCRITPDQRWLLTGRLLVDLDGGNWTLLDPIHSVTGERVNPNDPAPPKLRDYLWLGDQQLMPGHRIGS